MSVFSPIAHKKVPKECYLITAGRFVGKVGRRKHYPDAEVEEYQKYINKLFPHQHSYYQECRRLLQFLRRPPGADKQRELPLDMPKMPDTFYQPTFSQQDVESLIWSTVINDID